MAAAGKKKMKASLKVHASKELTSKTKPWVNSIPELKKLYGSMIEYSEDVELDPRKWNPGKLSKALFALVRYELKLLDGRTSQFMKDYEKAKDDKAKKNVLRAVEKEFNGLAKEMKDKCSLALEELVADKGDNKKGLRDGKAALKRLADVKVDKVFSSPRRIIVTSLRTLNAGLWEAEEALKEGDQAEAKATREKVLKTAAKDIGAAKQVFDGDGKDAEAAVRFLIKTAADIKKNKEANAKLKEFGKMIESEAKTLALFVNKVEGFTRMTDDTMKQINGGRMSSRDSERLEKAFLDAKAMEKTGVTVNTALGKLRKEFNAVEKELK